MKKIIAKVKALFTKKETPVIVPDAIVEDTYVPPVVIQEVKKPPTTKRKPGPKKQVPGEPAIKKSNQPSGTPKKRTNKPKPKVQ